MTHLPRWLIAVALTLMLSGPRGEAFVGLDGKLAASSKGVTPATPPPAPKTTLPQPYLDAIVALRGSGLSDPTGYELRRVEIKVEDPQKVGLLEVETFGWVDPAGDWAVAMDGLTYEVLLDLGPASLADLPAPSRQSRLDIPWVDQPGIALPALLYIQGHTLEAEQTLDKLGLSDSEAGIKLYDFLIERYRRQAGQYLAAREDAAARDWAQGLVSVADLREISGEKIEANVFGLRVASPAEPKQILRDATRRFRDPKPTFDLQATKELPMEERHAALVEALDDVSLPLQDAGILIEWTKDPLIAAIVAEGEPVIPALLDALEKDDRMTRTYFVPPRRMRPPVHFTTRTAAWGALVALWPMADAMEGELTSQKVAKLRQTWEKTRDLSPAERWLEVLRDDTATPTSWLAAARGLTNHVLPKQGEPTPPDWQPEMLGAPLKATAGEEITQLLLKRTKTIATAPAKRRSSPGYDIVTNLQLANCLAKWDLTQALPTLQELSQSAKKAIEEEAAEGERRSSMSPAPPSMTRPSPRPRVMAPHRSPLMSAYTFIVLDRLEAGDDSATADYTELLQKSDPGEMMMGGGQITIPLWKYPDNPRIQAAAEPYFNRFLAQLSSEDGSPWPMYSLMQISQIQMVGCPAFRKFAATVLRSEETLGTAELVEQHGQWGIQVKSRRGGSIRLRSRLDEAEIVKLTKAPVEITLGDYQAAQLDSWDAKRRFNVLAPEAERAAARENLAKWLMDPEVDWPKVIENHRQRMIAQREQGK